MLDLNYLESLKDLGIKLIKKESEFYNKSFFKELNNLDKYFREYFNLENEIKELKKEIRDIKENNINKLTMKSKKDLEKFQDFILIRLTENMKNKEITRSNIYSNMFTFEYYLFITFSLSSKYDLIIGNLPHIIFTQYCEKNNINMSKI